MSNKKVRINNVGKSARAAIVDLLCHCEEGAFANEIVPARLSRSNFSDADRALITKVVYSTLRAQVRIDFALSKISSRPIEKLDPIVLSALRSILAQLIDNFNMYAVVDETVKVLPFSMKGFVNAISRKAIEKYEQDKLFEGEPKYVSASMPKWIYDEMESVFPDRIASVAEALNSSTKVTLAPTSDRKLQLDGAESGSLVEGSLLIRSAGDIANLDLIKDGQAIVVDQGSQLVAKVVDAQIGDRVLDACCAPGGKTILIAKSAESVLACDLSSDRLEKLADTLTRVKKDNVKMLACDARTLPISADLKFDRILIDAPCSGLGVLRRRPDARHRIQKSDVKDLVALQKEIFTSVSPYIKPGGYLIYSVCTFSQAETIEIDRWIEDGFPEFAAEEIDSRSPLFNRSGRGYLLSPSSDNDAMYVLKLRKS